MNRLSEYCGFLVEESSQSMEIPPQIRGVKESAGRPEFCSRRGGVVQLLRLGMMRSPHSVNLLF